MKNTKKNIIGFVLLAMMIVQVLAINITVSIYKDFSENQEHLTAYSIKSKEVLINDIISTQQKNILNSIKQSWIKYVEHNNIDILARDENGYPIYIHDLEYVGYDSSTMYKERISEYDTYNIYETSTNKLIISEAIPKWNKNKIKEILDIIISPIKVFGNNGGIIVFDSNNGDIFLDTTPQLRLKNNKDVSIFDDMTSAHNSNKAETRLTCEGYFKLKKDSNNISNIVYMFNEPTEMGKDAFNFEKYKLGDYNRQFIEMAIMPYETIGFEGQSMQLSILVIVDEQDIAAQYKYLDKQIEEIINVNKELYGSIIAILVISLFATMIVMLISVYIIKYKKQK